MSGRIYLNVPYEEKDFTKRLGARWDADKRRWYTTQENLNENPALVFWHGSEERRNEIMSRLVALLTEGQSVGREDVWQTQTGSEFAAEAIIKAAMARSRLAPTNKPG